MYPDLFIHEDLTKPENRINLSIFGLLIFDVFREWLLRSLDLPPSAVLYPTKNISTNDSSARPDFVVRQAEIEEPIAWIEVECWSNLEQLLRFRKHLPARVIAIWGRRECEADLGLDEIAQFIDDLDIDRFHEQVRCNLQHLRDLIREAQEGRSSSSIPPRPVADAVLETTFVRALRQALGPRLNLDIATRMRPGEIRANTRGERGFSLRVYSRLAADRSVSLLHQSRGLPEIVFPSKAKLEHYLPLKADAIEALVALVAKMGGDMVRLPVRGRTPVPIRVAEQHVGELGKSIVRLAG